ncbi:MAG: hypothetical protein Q7W56_04655 [Candidatus Latescibacteria bacterium]|nr:hypothetical protein [Candidatus Latescibacterota bacterium]
MMLTTRNHSAIAAAAVLLALLSLATPRPAGAGQALNAAYGDVATFRHPEIEAMSGTGAALFRGGFSAVLNPAMLGEAAGWRLDAAGSLAQDHEDRFQPLWDSFGSYITDTAIASNRSHDFDSGFALSGRALPRLGVGAALTSRYDFGYEFREEVRDPSTTADPYDQILEERSVVGGGSLRDLSLGAAWEPGPGVSVGATVHYVFGTRTLDFNRRDVQVPADSYLVSESHEADGMNATLGVRACAGERFVLGAAWDTPLKVEGDWTTTTTLGAAAPAAAVEGVSVRYPGRLRAGLAYYPRSEPRTVFAADVVYTEWKELEDSRDAAAGSGLENTMDVQIGVQHTFYNGVPLRFGFRHLDSYADREAGTASFNAGVGFPYAAGMFSVSAELGKLSSRQEHWYPYPAGYAVAPTSRVEDNRFRVGAGLTYAF